MAWTLVFAAVQVALAVPQEERLSAPEVAALLDYSGLPGTVSPLSEEYIADVLGHPVPSGQEPGVQPVGSAPPPVTSEPGSPPTSDDEHPGRATASHPATNDDLADAYQVPSVPFTATTDASTATRETGEPDDCAPLGPTLWYRYTPSEDGVLMASTTGSEGLVSLAVFAGHPAEVEALRCHRNPLGYAATAFPVDAGTTYYFQVTAVLQAPVTGTGVSFHLDPFGPTDLVSVDADGQQYFGTVNTRSAVTADGRFVAFSTFAGFVPDDENETWDVYVKDRRTGTIERVSVASDGSEGNDYSGLSWTDMSADGRFVVFHSSASNLVEDDTNDWIDVFVHDRQTGVTERVSVSSDGTQGEWRGGALAKAGDETCNTHAGVCPYYGSAISANGRYVAFASDLAGLVETSPVASATRDPDDRQIYLHDRATGETTLVSRTPAGEPGGDWSMRPDISADGRYVGYVSRAHDIAGGELLHNDAFVFDRRTAENELVSVSTDSRAGNEDTREPTLSSDGRYIVFPSHASNLVPGDTNDVVDVFVHDRASGTTSRVSLDSSGAQAPRGSGGAGYHTSISADGRHVVFEFASDLTEFHVGQTQTDVGQIYLRDRLAGTTVPLSVSPSGALGNRTSGAPSITPDGRSVVFWSWASNLVEGDDNPTECLLNADVACSEAGRGHGDVFVHTFPVLR